VEDLLKMYPGVWIENREEAREYGISYRGPGFLAKARFGSSATLLSPPVSKLDRQNTGRLRKRDGGRGRSQIIRQRESLVLYKSFNTLWRKLKDFLCSIVQDE
jgi:hypothetical protein